MLLMIQKDMEVYRSPQNEHCGQKLIVRNIDGISDFLLLVAE